MKRAFAYISGICGLGIVIYSLYLMYTGVYFDVNFIGRNRIFMLIGAALLVVGSVGIIISAVRDRGLSDEEKNELAKKRKRAFKSVSVGVVIIALLSGYVYVIENRGAWESDRFEDALGKYVKNEYTAYGASLPENAKYNFYDGVTKTFTPKEYSGYRGLASVPRRINVIVVYKKGRENIGYWEDSSGHYIGGAYQDYYDLTVVKLDDWSVIAEERIYAEHSDRNEVQNESGGYDYVIDLSSHEIRDWLNGIFK